MDTKLLPGAAKDQLNIVLGFFPRVDSKSSVVLAVNTAMLGYLASRIPSLMTITVWQLIAPALTFI